METHPVLGWPIVTAENYFDVVQALGIRRWPRKKEPVTAEDFIFEAVSGDEKAAMVAGGLEPTDYLRIRYLLPWEAADLRFVPKPMIGFWEDPQGKLFRGGYIVNKPAMTVVALINDLVPVTAEWKHGIDRVTLVPVSGVPGKDEAHLPTLFEKMHAAAIHEWHEETGTHLEDVVCLSPRDGITVTVRNTETRYYEFFGRVKEPIAKGPTKFDATETLKMVLFPWGEWLRLIYNEVELHPDFTIEACAVSTTLRAAHILKR